ncbi:class I SAM-dependent methyltransferase [Pannus brasiliensis CCIBt3594]|uniref:Class I SAM-dependent methyltransferase n=1 Tax=Pannus brasiliensis CCIBt3594 TaxID=1427578 RepID=A0AAW9QNQ4_9CHRO
MSALENSIAEYAKTALERRKTWYSSVAGDYHQVRPRYPREIIRQVIEITGLSDRSNVLEIGCGPGTATLDFAKSGCSMTCLEPNPDFYRFASENCQPYPRVKILNTSLEEWPIEVGAFSAVIAASSFHWIPKEIAYPKSADALEENGFLILLWNTQLQPKYEIYQRLAAVYQQYAPSLDRYEDNATRAGIFREFGEAIENSGRFQKAIYGQIESTVTYSIEDYITLLKTYSPYMKLEERSREDLFDGIRDCLDREFEKNLELSFISAFQIARKSEND